MAGPSDTLGGPRAPLAIHPYPPAVAAGEAAAERTGAALGLVVEAGVDHLEEVELGVDHAEADVEARLGHELRLNPAVGAVGRVTQRILEVSSIVRNFLCQTLKISKVSLIVMGS
jgi:hypothetical protein